MKFIKCAFALFFALWATMEVNAEPKGRLIVDAGVSGVIWNRTVGWETLSYEDFGKSDRRTVPVVYASMVITDTKSGLGLNLAYLPRIKNNGIHYSTHTVMLQTTYQF